MKISSFSSEIDSIHLLVSWIQFEHFIQFAKNGNFSLVFLVIICQFFRYKMEREQTMTENGFDKKIKEIQDEHYSNSRPEEFSSENFKIEISGMPKSFSFSKMKNLLTRTLKLKPHRIRSGGRSKHVFVSFKNEENRDKAISLISGYNFQGNTLKAQIADPAHDPVMLAKIDGLKDPEKSYESLPWPEQIEKAVIPLVSQPYEQQLSSKSKSLFTTLRKFGNELSRINPELAEFVRWQKFRRKGSICEIDDIVPSPLLEGYRNKCEFTIGKCSISNKPVVGFRLASYSKGCVEVRPIDHLKHINMKMKKVVKRMEAFLAESPYETFDPFSHKGVWRQLCIRTTNNNDILLILQIHPQEMTNEEIGTLKEDLKKFFTVGDGSDAGVTSMFCLRVGQLESGKEIQYEHLFGSEYIQETILEKTFIASPDAFLQVNTPACEKLYEKVRELAELDSTTVLLDICCGVGTIGITFADNVCKVFGVECIEKAVKNARCNADKNGVANAVFYHGKAEDYIENILFKSQKKNCVAILDPPRGGLPSFVINSLRKCEYLDKIIYISCNLQGALANFQALCKPRSKTCKGSYFIPLKAAAVDLFPDTPHFESIVVFERYEPCKWDHIMAGNPLPKDQEYFDRICALTAEEEREMEERRTLSEKKRRQRSQDRSHDEEHIIPHSDGEGHKRVCPSPHEDSHENNDNITCRQGVEDQMKLHKGNH